MSFFNKDSLPIGLTLSLALSIIAIFIIMIIMRATNIDILSNMKLMLFAPIPSILLLRYYAKEELHKSLRGSIIALCFAFLFIIIVLLKYNYISIR